MSGTKTTSDQNISLPIGLHLYIDQIHRNFKYNAVHGKSDSGDATLHGLYELSGEKPKKEKSVTTKRFISPFSVADPDESERAKFAYNCIYLPEILTKSGLVILDDNIKKFYEKIEIVQKDLKTFNGKIVPPERIKKYESSVNQYATQCVELKIKCNRVTLDNPKGSHQLKSGMFMTTKVIRTVFVDRPLTEAELDQLVIGIVRTEELGGKTAVKYTVVPAKEDKNTYVLKAKVSRSINPTD